MTQEKPQSQLNRKSQLSPIAQNYTQQPSPLQINQIELTDMDNIQKKILDNSFGTDQNRSETNKTSNRTRYKSAKMSYIIGIIISLSSLNYGYALSACSVINQGQIRQLYGITLSSSLTNSLLIGLMPAGGIFGAMFNQVFVKYFSRKYSIFVMCGILWVGLALIMIHNPYTIFIGRFIEGFAEALYLSLGPIYLKQVTAKELRQGVLAMFGLGKAFGSVLAYTLQNIFNATGYSSNSYTSSSYIVLLTFNGYIAIIQVVLYILFVPHSPLELVGKQKIDFAKRQLLLIYNQQYIEDALAEYVEEHTKTLEANNFVQLEIKQTTVQELAFKKKAKTAFLMGVHVVLIRQFMGPNCVTTFSRQIIAVFNEAIASFMSLILNVVQLICNLLSVIFLVKRFGRRPIMLVGVGLMTLFSYGIGISLIQQSEIPILLFMCIFMGLNGATVLTACYSYPSQVLAPQLAVYANVLNWIGLTIVTSVPPLVVGAMPNNNAYPLFFFFGTYGIFATIVVYIWMKQSVGLTYKQLIESF